MTSLVSNAGYFPDWLVIRLPVSYKWIFSAQVAYPDDPADRARALGIFFHEWAHHFHNISTVSGIFAYSTTVSLWSSFRWTVTDGWDSAGAGSTEIPAPHRLNIERTTSYFDVVRNKRQCNSKLNQSSVGFAFYEDADAITATPIMQLSPWSDAAPTEIFHVLRCQARRARPGSGHAYENLIVEIGTLEIAEGVASMLEDLLVTSCCPDAITEPADFAPYKLLRRLTEHFIPDINNALAIACGVAALQHPDPPTGLLSILRELAEIDAADRMQRLEEIAVDFVTRNLSNIERHLTQLDNFFPVDEPMAEAAKWLNDAIRVRIGERMSEPFPELALAMRIARDPYKILEAIVDRSCAFLFLPPSNGQNSAESADLLELRPRYKGGDEERFQHGRLKMLSALHFLHQHRGEGGILSSHSVLNSSSLKSRCCPLYHMCEHPPRLGGDPNCLNAPWRVGNSTGKEMEICWYSAGAYASRCGLGAEIVN